LERVANGTACLAAGFKESRQHRSGMNRKERKKKIENRMLNTPFSVGCENEDGVETDRQQVY